MTQWEYHEEAVPLGQQRDVLGKAGADGWELCAMLGMEVQERPPVRLNGRGVLEHVGPARKSPGFLLVFKRPLAEGARPAGAAEHEGLKLP